MIVNSAGLTPKETPQMVVITLDDAVVTRIMPFYKTLFDGRFKNPGISFRSPSLFSLSRVAGVGDGCPIRATFFVSHEWNNYDETQWLFYKGHEIGVNSIT